MSKSSPKPVRVLYSFPHKIGADRICTTAWEQVMSLHNAGAEVIVHPVAVAKPLDREIKVHPTLAWGRIRIPYRVIGNMRAFKLHDTIVASRLKKLKTP